MRACRVQVGDKVVVTHVEQHRPVVYLVQWVPSEYRYFIGLLWDNGETSNVWSSDYGKYWVTEKDHEDKALAVN